MALAIAVRSCGQVKHRSVWIRDEVSYDNWMGEWRMNRDVEWDDIKAWSVQGK